MMRCGHILRTTKSGICHDEAFYIVGGNSYCGYHVIEEKEKTEDMIKESQEKTRSLRKPIEK